MVQVIVSTVGTSLLRNMKVPHDAIAQVPVGEETGEQMRAMEKVRAELLARMAEKGNDMTSWSAEIHSLSRIGVSEGDRLIFLTTETLDGYLCGDVLHEFLKKRWGVDGSVHMVKGLQVQNGKRFADEGIDNLADLVLRILERYPPEAYKVILNPTGGFKAVVPYMTLIGLAFGLPMKYIYEQSTELITLPAAPVSLNVEHLGGLGSLVYDLANTYLAEKDVAEHLGISVYELRNKYKDVLVWQEEGMVSLSGLARVLYRRLVRERGDDIRVSRTVKKLFRKNQSWESVFQSYFEKMRDPAYRTKHLHNQVQNEHVDLDCLKPGNVSERIFYYVEDHTVYICYVDRHDEYERLLKTGNLKLTKASYQNDFD